MEPAAGPDVPQPSRPADGMPILMAGSANSTSGEQMSPLRVQYSVAGYSSVRLANRVAYARMVSGMPVVSMEVKQDAHIW